MDQLTYATGAVPPFGGIVTRETVVFLLPRYPAWYAPALGTEMRLLRKHGIDVQVLTFDAKNGEASFVQRIVSGIFGLSSAAATHVRVVVQRPAVYRRALRAAWRLATVPGQKPLRRALWFWYFLRAISAGDKLHRAGVARCHAHFTTNMAVLIAEAFRIEMSLTFHGPTDFAGVPPALLRAKVKASSFVRTVSLDGFQCVLDACTAAERSRVVYAPLGVDLKKFPRRFQDRGVRPVRIVCVARLEPVKGHFDLLEAFARVLVRGRAAELLLIGHGRLLLPIRRRVRDSGLQSRVIVAGMVDNADLPSLLQAADLFVLASRAEGLPVAIMEAMATGLPCIATNVNGVPELVVNEETGLLVPSGDVAALAGALIRLIDAPSLRARLGAAGRRRVVARHDGAANAERMAACLLNHARSGTDHHPTRERTPAEWMEA